MLPYSPTSSRETEEVLTDGPTVTTTAALPAVKPEARVQVMAVADPATPVQAVLPTATVVWEPVETTRLVPVMVRVPPAVDMAVGLRIVTVGISAGSRQQQEW